MAFLLTGRAQRLDRLLPEAAELALEEADRVGVGETDQSLGLGAVVGQVDRQVVEADAALDAQGRFRVVVMLWSGRLGREVDLELAAVDQGIERDVELGDEPARGSAMG